MHAQLKVPAAPECAQLQAHSAKGRTRLMPAATMALLQGGVRPK